MSFVKLYLVLKTDRRTDQPKYRSRRLKTKNWVRGEENKKSIMSNFFSIESEVSAQLIFQILLKDDYESSIVNGCEWLAARTVSKRCCEDGG